MRINDNMSFDARFRSSCEKAPRPSKGASTRRRMTRRPQSIKVDRIISTASTGRRMLSQVNAIERVLSPMTPAQSTKGYTGQSMASAMKAKIMETLPIENRSRSDMALPLAAVIFDGQGSERVQRESRNAHRVPKRPPAEPGRGGGRPAHAFSVDGECLDASHGRR